MLLFNRDRHDYATLRMTANRADSVESVGGRAFVIFALHAMDYLDEDDFVVGAALGD